MKDIRRRVKKLEESDRKKDPPCMAIMPEPGQSEEEAVAAFLEKYPDVQGTLVILD